MRTKKKWRNWQKLTLSVGCVLGACILIVAGYVIYVFAQYYRVDDNLKLTADGNAELLLGGGEMYSISTLNLGFGAYEKDYSFFMDSAVKKDGKKVTGKYSRGLSKENVRQNCLAAYNKMNFFGTDFIFLQEVDKKGDRSYDIDEVGMARASFKGYGSVFAQNYDSAYLYYPIGHPIGKNRSGIMSFSRYYMENSTRRSLPVSKKFDKFFDLDRCIAVSRIPIKSTDRYLTLINVHLSAYDKGGVIRKTQLETLRDILANEREAGNFVVAGGDFNLDLMESTGKFPSIYQTPDWLKSLDGNALPQGFNVVEPFNKDTVATCRTANQSYKAGEDYLAIVDGFIVSDNVEVVRAANIDCGFEFSDHNPVGMSFRLEET